MYGIKLLYVGTYLTNSLKHNARELNHTVFAHTFATTNCIRQTNPEACYWFRPLKIDISAK